MAKPKRKRKPAKPTPPKKAKPAKASARKGEARTGTSRKIGTSRKKPGKPKKTIAKPKLRGNVKRARPISKHPEAVRSRRRREDVKKQKAKRPGRAQTAARARAERERKGIADAKRAEAEGLAGNRPIAPKRPKKRRGPGRAGKAGKTPPAPPTIDELRELAIGWLEALRDVASTITPTSLDVTDPSGRAMDAGEQDGIPEPANQRRRAAGRRPWLVVGRFDFLQGIGYEEVGAVLAAWRDDFALEVAIHPDRLSQIRIVYEDPNERRHDGDDFISSIGAWAFVVSDLVFEILGTGGDAEADQDALIARYANSIVPRLYVYFSPDLMGGTTDIGREVVQRFRL